MEQQELTKESDMNTKKVQKFDKDAYIGVFPSQDPRQEPSPSLMQSEWSDPESQLVN